MLSQPDEKTGLGRVFSNRVDHQKLHSYFRMFLRFDNQDRSQIHRFFYTSRQHWIQSSETMSVGSSDRQSSQSMNLAPIEKIRIFDELQKLSKNKVLRYTYLKKVSNMVIVDCHQFSNVWKQCQKRLSEKVDLNLKTVRKHCSEQKNQHWGG